jgi:hypothetical protein
MKPPHSVPISYILPGWLRTPVLPIEVGTEVRVIFPAFLLAVALVVAARLLGEGLGQFVSLLGYGFGCTAMGSIAAGRDFVHRTVGSILSLPCSRTRIWWTRLWVSLAGMVPLAALAGLSWQQFPGVSAHDSLSAILVLVAPVLSGLLVAPWLTLLCRSPLAGTVFTAALPFVFWMLSELVAVARFGFDYSSSSETVGFKVGVMGLMLLAHWVAGAFFGWRKFLRLEAIEGRVGELHLPRWLSRRRPAKPIARSSAPGRPFWQLVKKELRLQQIAFGTTGLFLLVWLGAWLIHRLRPELSSAFMDLGTFLFVGLLSLLIGAVASSEERQLGTAEWQILLPVAARKQWMVKVATVFGLTVLLAALLPVSTLYQLSWGNEFKDGWTSLATAFSGVALALTTMSLYISSTCNHALKAMLVSLPASVGMLAAIGIVVERFDRLPRWYARVFDGEVGVWQGLAASLPLLLLLGLFLLTLHFALVNHRFAERNPGRIWRQAGTLVAYIALSAAATIDLFFLLAEDRSTGQAQTGAPSASAAPGMPAVIPPGADPDMMKRYGLLPKNTPVRIATNMSEHPQVPAPNPGPGTSTTTQLPPRLNVEMMKRYGLQPPNAPAKPAPHSLYPAE